MSTEQREEVLSWLQTKDYWEIGELEYKLAFEYDVVYETKKVTTICLKQQESVGRKPQN